MDREAFRRIVDEECTAFDKCLKRIEIRDRVVALLRSEPWTGEGTANA